MMSKIENKKLLNFIRYTPFFVTLFFVFAINFIVIQDNRNKANHSVDKLKEELIDHRKDKIASQVNHIYRHLFFEKKRIDNEIKLQTKHRVIEAYDIANYIFSKYPDKSDSDVKNQIFDALRPVRFFDGRGYFFILDDFGNTIMHGGNPDLENFSIPLFLLKEDLEFFQSFNKLIENNNEGFLKWRFPKQNDFSGKKYEKMGYVKKFEPFDWVIGTGEYIEEVEKTLKSDVLDWFQDYKLQDDSSCIYILDSNGLFLSKLGVCDFYNSKDSGSLKQNLDFLINNDKAYFKKITGWDWVVGGEFYTKDFESHIAIEEALLEQNNHESLMRLLYLSLLSMVVLGVISLFLGKLIARRFEVFQTKITNDFKKLTDAKNQLEYMALYDDLTHLPNRVLMTTEIQKKILKMSDGDGKLAVVFVDLDSFKNVNDIYGHQAGDAFLEVVSRKFEQLIDEDSIVSRFGGDEFIFCYSNLLNTQDAENKASSIINALLDPLVVEGKTLATGCTIGLSMFPDDGEDAKQLISKAGTALYKAKSQRKGQWLFYSSSISDQIKTKINLQISLENAIRNNEISIVYQPQILSSKKKLVSVEALARWHNNALDYEPSPKEFIALAEETGLIYELGLQIFKKACEDIYSISPNGKDALKVSINISPIQVMEPSLGHYLINICNDIGIEISRITLEITENIFIHSLSKVQPLLEGLRGLGFGLSLDDFGTGYSSLSYINNLPLTEIKIDRSFIRKFLDSHQSDMLVRMIIEVGHLCGLVVVAEGVETERQLDSLTEYHCDLLQGYYLDKPIGIELLAQRVSQSLLVNKDS